MASFINFNIVKGISPFFPKLKNNQNKNDELSNM